MELGENKMVEASRINIVEGAAKAEEALDDGPKEVSHEEMIKGLDTQIGDTNQVSETIAASIGDTGSKLSELRDKIGLPPQEEDAPSMAIEKEMLAKKAEEKTALENEREEMLARQERQRRIEEEKRRILQEKIDGLFEELAQFSSQEMKSMLASGQPSAGRNMESRHLGQLSQESARSLASAFAEGIKMLPEILKHIPDLLKEFDEELTKEAEKNVDEQGDDQKAETVDEDGRGDKQELPIGNDTEDGDETGSDATEGGTQQNYPGADSPLKQ